MNDTLRNQRSTIDPELLTAISNLTIKVRRVVEGLQGGAHRSPHLGASVEFAEHKRYSPGDDIRNIDWRALARTDRYFVKQHQREVILRSILALDCSASMGYQGSRASNDKLGFSVELLGAIAHILVRQGDAAGLMTFDSHPSQFIPPLRRPDHLTVLMKHLASAKPVDGEKTGFPEAIAQIAEYIGRPAMAIFATDLWGAKSDTEIALARLAARGHDVTIFYVLDPDEIDLPFDQLCRFRGLEGNLTTEADPALIRADYRGEIDALRDRWQRVCGEAGIDFVFAPTDRPVPSVLSDFITRRQNQGRRL